MAREKKMKASVSSQAENISIKKLLHYVFGFMLVLILVLGGLSIHFSRSIANQTAVLYNRPHTNLVGMWSIKAKAADVGSHLLIGISNGTPLSEEQRTAIATLGDDLRAIESNKVDTSAPMSDNMVAILEAQEMWSAKAQEISDLLDAGNSDQVTAADIEEYQALQNDLVGKLDSIIETASQNALNFKNSAASQATTSVIWMIVFFALACAFVLVVLKAVVQAITVPMSHMVQIAQQISKGNLNEPVTYDKDTEFGELADCFRDMESYLKDVVQDIEKVLARMGKGDFSAEPQIEYVGNFEPIAQGITDIRSSLSTLVAEITNSADMVSGGVDQLKQEAISLSEGATDQSSAMEELTATIGDISGQVENNAEGAKEASAKVGQIVDRIMNSNEQMQMLKQAIAEISDKSNEIGNIAKTIDEIAGQTNLLSLNASIEAARAGEAGKGFAVVAGEIKTLSEQSQNAVKNTTDLVSNCLEAIEKGNQLTEETAETLLLIAQEAQAITEVVESISSASQNQSEAVSQINMGMEQIADVIQNNSAAADETASSSENLADLADGLKGLVGKFRF